MNERAPEGQVFVCGACGKTARWRYGFDDKNKNDPEASPGWDSSCMTWSVLCFADKIDHGTGEGPMWQVVSSPSGGHDG